MKDKLGKLEKAGVIVKAPIPEEYAEVLEGLSEEEIDVVVSVKQRLDEAGASRGRSPAETQLNFIVI
jgi:hypothetical protein